MTERTHEIYDRDYAGHWHWKYTSPTAYVREWVKLRHHIVGRFGNPRGSRVLELACGQGFHVNVMRQLGMRATGVDISRKEPARPARAD